MNILVFHRIVHTKISKWEDVGLSIFEGILKEIVNSGARVLTINKISVSSANDIALTFDDGFLSDYEIVFPLLLKYNLKATFFIVPDFVGRKGYMSWKQIMHMSSSGMEIASHSKTHKHLTTLTDYVVVEELKISKNILEEKLNKSIESFSYPYGDLSKKLHNLTIICGYKNICTSEPGISKCSSRILYRNSINSNHSHSDIKSIVNPNLVYLLRRKVGYIARIVVKRIFGFDNYLMMKKVVFRGKK